MAKVFALNPDEIKEVQLTERVYADMLDVVNPDGTLHYKLATTSSAPKQRIKFRVELIVTEDSNVHFVGQYHELDSNSIFCITINNIKYTFQYVCMVNDGNGNFEFYFTRLLAEYEVNNDVTLNLSCVSFIDSFHDESVEHSFSDVYYDEYETLHMQLGTDDRITQTSGDVMAVQVRMDETYNGISGVSFGNPYFTLPAGTYEVRGRMNVDATLPSPQSFYLCLYDDDNNLIATGSKCILNPSNTTDNLIMDEVFILTDVTNLAFTLKFLATTDGTVITIDGNNTTGEFPEIGTSFVIKKLA